MSSVRDLYQRIILEHGRAPRNFRLLEGAGIVTAERRNVTCGDRILIAVALDEDVIRDIAFQGTGCAISMASASTMTEAVKTTTRAEALRWRERFAMLVQPAAGEPPPGSELDPTLGELAAFRGVARFPVRIPCATIPWDALRDALL